MGGYYTPGDTTPPNDASESQIIVAATPAVPWQHPWYVGVGDVLTAPAAFTTSSYRTTVGDSSAGSQSSGDYTVTGVHPRPFGDQGKLANAFAATGPSGARVFRMIDNYGGWVVKTIGSGTLYAPSQYQQAMARQAVNPGR